MTQRAAVFGSGTMGNGIAHVFAQCGWDVQLVDVDQQALERAMATIGKNMGRQVKKGALTEDEKEAALGRIRPMTSLQDSNVAIAVEAATENLDIKVSILAGLSDALPADAILASNTSSISITELAAKTGRADRFIGMHFMNPVPMMKLVEVIRGHHTSNETTKQVVEWAKALGKTPVEVHDYPGFVANRILMPMINEAVYCVMEGVGEAEAIDTVMKLGMNHPMGPLALADLIGLDVCLAIMEVLHDGLGDSKYRPCPLLRRMVLAGDFGRKTGRGFYTYD